MAGAMEPQSRQPPAPSRILGRGDPAPWFRAPALSGSPAYAFDTVAGRHVLMLFFGSARIPAAREALAHVQRHRNLFDDRSACFFGITNDPQDAEQGRIAQQLPGIRFFLDLDHRVSALYGAEERTYRPHWLLLDPALRVLATWPLQQGEQAIGQLRDAIAAPAPDLWAPVLMVPNVLKTELCAGLIRGYEAHGGEESGFMRDVDGKTMLLVDPNHKQRRDWTIADEKLRRAIVVRMNRHLTVPIERAFQFRPTRIERYLVACYDAGAGYFRPHRDNTTKGTAHRKFAVTINLNAGDYEGGDLRFPEYGARTYRAPTGGAIVFSCSLLHEATPVTKGRRFAFLPFLYDEEGARLREANNPHLGEGVSAYRMGTSEGASPPQGPN
jgi:predicted 2-oxoglutarate/Fe(II)-dependent dioxygenase YbiX/peroxiredoxin